MVFVRMRDEHCIDFLDAFGLQERHQGLACRAEMPCIYQYIFTLAGLNQVCIALLGGIVDVDHRPNKGAIEFARKPQPCDDCQEKQDCRDGFEVFRTHHSASLYRQCACLLILDFSHNPKLREVQSDQIGYSFACKRIEQCAIYHNWRKT